MILIRGLLILWFALVYLGLFNLVCDALTFCVGFAIVLLPFGIGLWFCCCVCLFTCLFDV